MVARAWCFHCTVSYYMKLDASFMFALPSAIWLTNQQSIFKSFAQLRKQIINKSHPDSTETAVYKKSKFQKQVKDFFLSLS